MSKASSSEAIGPDEASQREVSTARKASSSSETVGPYDRRFELPGGLTPEQERAIIRALERYFARESPHPDPWVLAGRVDAAGLGALQARRYTDTPWGVGIYAPYARRGVPPLHGRGDVG